MAPLHPLPFSDKFEDANDYVESLLEFATSSLLFQTLCGGVHILDFFTQEPNTYAQVIPPEWASFFKDTDIMDILDLLMRDDLAQLSIDIQDGTSKVPLPLLEFIREIRKNSLNRDFPARKLKQEKLPRHVAVGMVEKKVHEVVNFSSYVDALAEDIARSSGTEITHFVDFGSGQNYLGRSLASSPYDRRIIAVESKKHNITGAKEMDVLAKLSEREKVLRNKKLYRQQVEREMPFELLNEKARRRLEKEKKQGEKQEAPVVDPAADFRPMSELESHAVGDGKGMIQYVEHNIQDGDLSSVVAEIKVPEAEQSLDVSVASISPSEKPPSSQDLTVDPKCDDDTKQKKPDNIKLMAISIHSCGNLSHHGIRSLLLNPSVHAIAIVGCCYNLLTERLGPPTYKLPNMRPNMRPINARVTRESEAHDVHGFPMSNRLATYKGDGIRMNITARMMAVQAPQNWTDKESDAFFTRHFFRALLQKVFLDRGVVTKPKCAADFFNEKGTHKISPSLPGTIQDRTEPVIIGSLGKGCYVSFASYVKGAIKKLMNNPERGEPIREKMDGISDEEVEGYVRRYGHRKKELSVMWSLMAFCAGVVESLIVVDRWLFLREHGDVVGEAWVETVFDYGLSPRNLVVVGIKR